MSTTDPSSYKNPAVGIIHSTFGAFVEDVSYILGPPAARVECLAWHSELTWTAVWFPEDQNNNLKITLTGSTIKVETHGHRDPTAMVYYLHSPDRLYELLRRFAPDHWKS